MKKTTIKDLDRCLRALYTGIYDADMRKMGKKRIMVGENCKVFYREGKGTYGYLYDDTYRYETNKWVKVNE